MKSAVFLKAIIGPLPSEPLSGRCAACGIRIEQADGYGVYQHPSGTRYLYILCDECKPLMESGDEDVIESVELRCRAGSGWVTA